MPATRWSNPGEISPRRYRCGHRACGELVASTLGFYRKNPPNDWIYVCSNCDLPTYFDESGKQQIPGPLFGQRIPHVPPIVATAYDEARDCMTVSAFTAVAQMCRKILMNVAHDQGAGEGLKFIQYVEYLDEKNYIPEGCKGWVDHIRKGGGEATHEIKAVPKAEAERLMKFTEMLLRIIYEYPADVPAPLLTLPGSSTDSE